jgi:hypothetical protein
MTARPEGEAPWNRRKFNRGRWIAWASGNLLRPGKVEKAEPRIGLALALSGDCLDQGL